jgi:beta-lactamase class A
MFAILLALAITVPKVKATVGYAAMDLDTGRFIGNRPEQRFPMGSVYKLPIGIALLQRVDRGELSLATEYTLQPSDFSPGWSPVRDKANGKPVTMTLGALFDAMVSDSDNSCSDFIQGLLGSGTPVTKAMRALKIYNVRVDRTEKQIKADVDAKGVADFNSDVRDTASPVGMVDLLLKIYTRHDGLKKESHDLLMRTLESSRNPVRIAKLLPPGTIVAHKTGSMPGVLNDTAIVTSPDGKHHIAMAIFVNRARPDTDGVAKAQVIESVAKQIYDFFTQ